MATTRRDSPELSPEAQRLLQFIRYNGPAGPIGTAIVLSAWWWLPEFRRFIPFFLAGTILNWILVARARRLAREDRVESAVFAISAGPLYLSLAIGVIVPMVYAFAVVVAIIPVVVAVAYLRPRALFKVAAAATASAAAGAIATWLPPLYEMPAGMVLPVLVLCHGFTVALVASASLALWHSNSRLMDTLEETRASNRALAESERTLERKVDERTLELASKNAALERTQSDLALARDEALEASRAKSTFLANMSHELRTPLNAIIGYSEMLQEEAREDGAEGYIPDLDRILTSGRYLLTLINGVLDLSKIEAGKMDVFLEGFPVDDVIQGVRSTIDPLVKKNANTLEVSVRGQLGAMHSDLTKIRQVLFNLLSNASKFTEGGTISLEAVRSGESGTDALTFRVRDTGIGMAPEQLGRIFEAFNQADASTTREYGGTGLGLSITKSFCEVLGGSIEASSTLGEGSCFTVRLPADARGVVSAAAPAGDVAGPITGIEGGAVMVLVVDDDPAARDLLGRFLSREGFGVVTASSGAEALRIARERRPDIVTLDIVMPQMDGWTVLNEFKADPDLADVPVILVTMLEDRNMGFTLGASEFLTKPIDWELLGRVLKKYEIPAGTEPALVVDDDSMARDMLRRGLERGGWTVVEAENGRVALERVAERTPQLILLDLMMPEMDGFEFVVALRARDEWRTIPIIVVTAKELTAEDRRRLEGNVSRVLEKASYRREELLDEVRRLVGDRVARGEDAGAR